MKIFKFIIIVVLFTMFVVGVQSYSSRDIKLDDNQSLELQYKDSVINFYKSIIDKDLRLKQHFYAVMYADSQPSNENIIKFLNKCEFENVDEAYITARLETNNGEAGIGIGPYYNHFGMKNASKRFSWSEGVAKSGYVRYKSWTYSYLDFFEYKAKKYKNWQKNANKLKIKNNFQVTK